MYRKAEYTEQNPDSKTYTAGIDALRSYPFQDKQWHLSAIEFHHKDEAEAVRLRDHVFALLEANPLDKAEG
jgi:hypothetical protein